MKASKKAVILVGHGGLPSNITPEIVENFMRVHKTRIKAGGPITEREVELDSIIRNWERTPENDPLQIRTRVTSLSHETYVEGLFSKNGLQRILLSRH